MQTRRQKAVDAMNRVRIRVGAYLQKLEIVDHPVEFFLLVCSHPPGCEKGPTPRNNL